MTDTDENDKTAEVGQQVATIENDDDVEYLLTLDDEDDDNE